MKKYYQVFLSSVSNEFAIERAKIIESIMDMDRFFPVAMEHMTAYDDTIQMLFSYMENSDMYTLILGDNMGSGIEHTKTLENLCSENDAVKKALDEYMLLAGVKNMAEITFTEVEYIFAEALNIKKGIFIKEETIRNCENGQSDTIRLYTVLRREKTYKKWKNYEKLIGEIKDTILKFSDELQETTAGWIRETDSKIYQSARLAGISNILLDGRIDYGRFMYYLQKAKLLKIIYTTGARFFDNYEEVLTHFVASGGSIDFLCAKPYSDVLYDVQKLEEEYLNGSREKIHREYEECKTIFQHISSSAQKISYEQNTESGRIRIGFCSTLFRSSFLLCVADDAAFNWGFLTITMPPYKSKDTVSFEISDIQADAMNNIFYKRARGHFDSIWKLAESENSIYNVEDMPSFTRSAMNGIISENVKQYWKEKEYAAVKNMRARKGGKRILIEVAAQHPLDDGLYPNAEFSARLDEAARIYDEKTAMGYIVDVYVPGSIHLDNEGIADERSLSSAGCEYLVHKGVPIEHIYGDDLNNADYGNKRYFTGVYNTADECFVAAEYFMGNSNFETLISVCSQNQVMRKTLFYFQFGVIPQIVTKPVEKPSHNFLFELFETVPYVLMQDHSWQAGDSEEAKRTRRERDPNYPKPK